MPSLSQTQSLAQTQVLAPQLQQSLIILQAPVLELRNLIQQEIQTNPTLEEESLELSLEDRKREHDEFQEEFERLAKLDEEWRDYMAQSSSYSGRSSEDEERRQFSNICWNKSGRMILRTPTARLRSCSLATSTMWVFYRRLPKRSRLPVASTWRMSKGF